MIYMNADDLRKRLNLFRETLLTPELKRTLNDFWQECGNAERAGLSIPPPAKHRVDEAINAFISVPSQEIQGMSACLSEYAPNVQAQVFERFLFADRYLKAILTEEVYVQDDNPGLLRRCLIEFWDSKEQLEGRA